jgi:serine/threonine-protein kinase
VAYTSDESGGQEVYIDAFPEPHGKKRISTAGGGSPSWGAGARELFYVSPENKLMAVSLNPGPDMPEILSAPRELFTLPLRSAAGPTYQPSRDGQQFLVLTSPETTLQTLTVILNWPGLLKN